MFYGSIGAEFLRVARATSNIADLSYTSKQLIKRMSNQNGQMNKMRCSLLKMVQKHSETFQKYDKSTKEIIESVGF